jgi:hypothetical protein
MEKKSVGLLELETAVLECFLEKTPLSPLGVKITSKIHSNFKILTKFMKILQLIMDTILHLLIM